MGYQKVREKCIKDIECIDVPLPQLLVAHCACLTLHTNCLISSIRLLPNLKAKTSPGKPHVFALPLSQVSAWQCACSAEERHPAAGRVVGYCHSAKFTGSCPLCCVLKLHLCGVLCACQMLVGAATEAAPYSLLLEAFWVHLVNLPATQQQCHVAVLTRKPW